MRRRLGVLTGTAALVLAATVVTAGPAGARNVGGLVPDGAECIPPGAVVLDGRAASSLPCICYVVEKRVFFAAGGPNTEPRPCPDALQRVKIDRNVGG